MRRTYATALLIVAIVAMLAGCGTRSDEQELGSLLDRVVGLGAPGAFVVVRDDGDERAMARGTADGRRPVHASDRFRIGSITKTFVAALVLRLVEDGRLRLSDPVERWLPGLVPDGHAITVRQLLSHTSGLPDYVDDEQLIVDRDRHWQPRELVALALAPPAASALPRGSYAYSSTNYIILGLLAERVGGADLESQLRERLFEPLGLQATSFAPGEARGQYVHGYRPPSHQGIVTGPPVDTDGEPAWWLWAAGGIVSTSGDLQRFFAALLGGEVLGPKLLREMRTLVPAGSLRYGLGIAAFSTPCGTAWGHTGNVLGTISVAWNTRDASRQVVLVINTYPLSAELEEAVRETQIEAFCGGV